MVTEEASQGRQKEGNLQVVNTRGLGRVEAPEEGCDSTGSSIIPTFIQLRGIPGSYSEINSRRLPEARKRFKLLGVRAHGQ